MAPSLGSVSGVLQPWSALASLLVCFRDFFLTSNLPKFGGFVFFFPVSHSGQHSPHLPPCRLRSPSLFPPTAAHTQFLLQTNPYFAALVEVLLVVGLALPFSLDDPATAAAEWLVGLCPAHPLEEKG